MGPCSTSSLENDLCFQTIKIQRISNWKVRVNPSRLTKFDSFPETCWNDYVWFFTKIRLGIEMNACILPFSSFNTLCYDFCEKVQFFFLYRNNPSGNASSAVIKYPCTKHISRARNPFPPNLRVTFNNNLESCRNNTFVIVNFASCFQT